MVIMIFGVRSMIIHVCTKTNWKLCGKGLGEDNYPGYIGE